MVCIAWNTQVIATASFGITGDPMYVQTYHVNIEAAHSEDAEEILRLQRLAYQSEAALYNDYSIPPLTQTLNSMLSDFQDQIFLKALRGQRIVGSVRAYTEAGSCFVGRLIVHPDSQQRGIGTELMNEIERRFRKVVRFELFTGHKSDGNISLYRKLGYRIFRHRKVNDRLTLVYLEKTVVPASEPIIPLSR
jgi:ribosomal protein S18 acetylase RimI-like enzyme